MSRGLRVVLCCACCARRPLQLRGPVLPRIEQINAGLWCAVPWCACCAVHPACAGAARPPEDVAGAAHALPTRGATAAAVLLALHSPSPSAACSPSAARTCREMTGAVHTTPMQPGIAAELGLAGLDGLGGLQWVSGAVLRWQLCHAAAPCCCGGGGTGGWMALCPPAKPPSVMPEPHLPARLCRGSAACR